MAQSRFETHQYSSEAFVESCGAILFDLSAPKKEVCLVQSLEHNNEWYFPKGRRNQGESQPAAAIREVMEETGYRCHLQPVTMLTRAPPVDAEGEDYVDKARIFTDITEPFMFTMRNLGGAHIKIIWWFIAALDEGARTDRLPGEAALVPQFFSCEKALEKLTFQNDREILQKAIDILSVTGF